MYPKFFICLLISITSLQAQVLFSEEASILGLSNTSYGGGTFGGGISFFDFNNDGWDDLTITSEEGQSIRFYRNNNGQFELVDFGINETLENKTVQWVDFDNDGDYDLFTTTIHEDNRLYENDGQMQFTNITFEAGLQIINNWSFGGSWGDYNNDGLLDLFLTSHRGPLSGYSNKLFRNNGNRTFTDVSVQAGILQDGFYSFCAAFFDFNKDGWQDIYVANDRTPVNHLYRNNGDGTFVEIGSASGTGVSIEAMSTAIDDANNDGYLDIYVTNTAEGNAFFKNNFNGTFTDLAPANGTLMESYAWGAVFLDGANRGIKDLFVSALIDDPSIGLTSAYYYNDGSGNYIIPSGIGFDNDNAESYANAIGDVNNDGYPDIAVLNYEPHDIFLYRNISTSNNNWIKVKLEGIESNRQGIGSWIEVSVNGESQFNYTLCGEGYLGQNSPYEFFGIGDATEIDYIKVTWLSGNVDLIQNPAINTQITVVEGSSLGTSDVGENNSFRIYPNPANDVVSIITSAEMIGGQVLIHNVNGRLLKKSVLETTETNLNVSEFASGVYFVTLENKDRAITKKLVVSK
ncbi:VCBS repeat-containing protein [Aureitalea sp. L0-47]|uniref:FG-GAP-like repeat-containing protein n=1 Tax=Aureitalea sp. L0-47 TaxID=2816962 RepID=UPI0022373F8A|nr:FG-GAP-like repeat-containing protein [Aureitalea sp. L0-47]MCW5519599.1 VCBS repeat-containing protein [Aureitalea sp. L0-47]